VVGLFVGTARSAFVFFGLGVVVAATDAAFEFDD